MGLKWGIAVHGSVHGWCMGGGCGINGVVYDIMLKILTLASRGENNKALKSASLVFELHFSK